MKSQKLQFDFDINRPDILAGLNNQQKTAVMHKNGPLLIIAGAGSGKTSVITKRIAYIIEQKWAKPAEILALTFTEKAASEMETRVDELVPYGYTDIWISTFHAFGDRLLRDYAIDLGLPANFKVLTSVEQAIFLRQNIYSLELNYFRPIANPLTHIQELLTHFSRLKDELITPKDYLTFADNNQKKAKDDDGKKSAERTFELAKAYQKYQELMIQSGNLDFGDQIFLTYKLLKDNSEVLKDCQQKFKFILVDEFQDTNYAQNEIVKLLSGKEGNITVVGDDDQSIYRFRGASISNIIDFKKFYGESKEIVLNQNYRSTQEILDSSYKLIQNNNPDRLEVQSKINKKLFSLKHGKAPELLFCDSLSAEADKVCKTILELKTERELKFNDFAILVRANSHADPFIQSLNTAGIPYIFSGASGLFSQAEIIMLISFIKSLVYTDDNLAFYQLATSEIYQISHSALSELYTEARRTNRSIFDLVSKDLSDSSDQKKLFELLSDINKYRQKKNDPIGEVLYGWLTKKKYLKKLSKDSNIENEMKIQNIAKFFDRIYSFNNSSESRGAIPFLESLELLISASDEAVSSDIDPDLEAVNILTVHAAKGLEWPAVFIVNCVADRFPSRKRREQLPIPDELIKERLPKGDWHLEEERRLFYVAATRAKDFLFLTAGEDYGGKRAKKISQFVLELLDEFDPKKLKHKSSPLEKIERFKKIDKLPSKLPERFSEKILKLSRQQIDDYFSCPKKFYFAHIIKIPLLENQQLMYGTAIHAALDHYFARKIKGEKLSIKQLHKDFKTAFKNVGFLTREQEELRFKQGLDSLAIFFDIDKSDLRLPAKVEEQFEFLEGKVKIRGRFDLIYKTGEQAEICDFKTSDVREQREAERRIKESTQMMIYALAWSKKYNKIPKTTLYFIESGLIGSIIFGAGELEKTRNMIHEVEEGIRSNVMTAKPDIFQCKYCPYKEICPEAI